MNKLLLLCPLFLFACASTDGSASSKANNGSFEMPFGEDPMNNPDFQAAMMSFATPGPEHVELMKSVGDWDVSGSMWMSPGAQAIPFSATAHTEPLIGGRYVMQEYKSSFMGEAFEGLMLMGFNNLTEEYFSVWIDSMGTGHSLTKGKKNKAGEIQMSGMMVDVMSPEGRPWRLTSKTISEDEVVFSMFDTLPNGTEWKVMEMTYSR